MQGCISEKEWCIFYFTNLATQQKSIHIPPPPNGYQIILLTAVFSSVHGTCLGTIIIKCNNLQGVN